MFPFGQLMLPVIGVVAIGLLVIGIKLFFFSGQETPMIVAAPESTVEKTVFSQTNSEQEQVKIPSSGNSTPLPVVSPVPKVDPVKTAKVKPVLAVPVTQDAQAAPHIVPSQGKTSVAKTDEKTAVPTSAPETEEEAALHVQKNQTGWGVQIGAFSVRKSADSVLSKVKKQGFEGELNQAQINGKVFYRVRVPSGSSRESANAMARKLKAKGYPTLIVALNQ